MIVCVCVCVGPRSVRPNRVGDEVLEADSARRRLTRRDGELQCRAGHWSSVGSRHLAGLTRREGSPRRGAFGANLEDLAGRCDGEQHRAIGGRGMVKHSGTDGKAWGGGRKRGVALPVGRRPWLSSSSPRRPRRLIVRASWTNIDGMDGQATPRARHNHHHISADCIRLFHETREKGKDDGGSRYDADRGCSEPGTDGAQSARPQLDGRHHALPKWKWSLA